MTLRFGSPKPSDSWDSESPEGSPGERILSDVQAVLERPNGSDGTRPRITLTYAQSLDGCISAERGSSTAISNDGSRKLTHSLRSMHDAILIGVNTVVVDDPQLTVRLVAGNSPRPVVVDSTLRTPPDARLLRGAGGRPLIATTRHACSDRADRLTEAGADIVRCKSAPDSGVDLSDLMTSLKAMGIRSLMIEGGAKIITSVFRGHLAHQVVIAIAPRFLGGVRSVESLDAVPLELRPRLEQARCESIAGDLVIHAEISNGA